MTFDKDGNLKLKVQSDATKYGDSQRNGVGLVSDIVALTAATLGRGKGSSSMLKGAIAKAGLKGIDGNFSNFGEDFASGAVLGLSVLIAGRIAEKYVATMPQAVKSAAEGAVMGFAQGTTTNYETLRRQNKSVLESALTAPIDIP